MKKLLVVFILSIFHLQGEETVIEPQTLMAPLMPMSREIPLEVSYENKEKYLLNPAALARQSRENILAVENKTIPWIEIFAWLTIGLLITFVKKHIKITAGANEHQASIPPEKKALKELLEAESLTDTTRYVNEVDRIIRDYVQQAFQINANVLTTEEVLAETMVCSELSQEQKTSLATLLSTNDQIKYAKKDPAKDTQTTTIALAKQIILNTRSRLIN